MSATKRMVDSFGRSLDERREWTEIQEEANKEARENWENQAWRDEFAADLTESILLGFDFETVLDRWFDVERTDFNGRIFVNETRGLKAFWMARGGYIEASALTSETSEVPRDMVGVHVYEFEDKLVNNFAQTARSLRDLSIRRMDAEVNRRILTVLQAAIPNGSDQYVSSAGVQKAALDAAIREVHDETNGGVVSVVGRRTMVDQVADFDGYADEAKEEIRKKGMIGVYRGANIISINNYKDEDDSPYFPANEMYVVAGDVGKLAFYGGLKSKEFTEQDNWYWHYLARRDSGLLVHHSERARRYVDTALSA